MAIVSADRSLGLNHAIPLLELCIQSCYALDPCEFLSFPAINHLEAIHCRRVVNDFHVKFWVGLKSSSDKLSNSLD